MSNGVNDGPNFPSTNPTRTHASSVDRSPDRLHDKQRASTGKGGHDDATTRQKTKFGKFMDDVGDAALQTVSTVAPVVPGGELLADAATGLHGLSAGAPGALSGGARADQMNKMWAMQEQNQVHNMQYLELQQEMQRDNRHFKTMSNLMKVRHDTAKSAIDNMRA